MPNKKSKELLEIVVKSGDDKLATDIVALDVEQVSPLADYFVMMSGNNERQVKAIVENLEEDINKKGFDIKQIEGKDGNKWILLDCYDVIVHVFIQSERSYYNLEKLWSDAPMINLNDWITE